MCYLFVPDSHLTSTEYHMAVTTYFTVHEQMCSNCSPAHQLCYCNITLYKNRGKIHV